MQNRPHRLPVAAWFTTALGALSFGCASAMEPPTVGAPDTHVVPAALVAPPPSNIGADRVSLDNGKEWSTIHAFQFENASPRDAASGLSSGKRQHKPVIVTREVDAASPKLSLSVQLPEVIVKFKGGTYELHGVVVTSVHVLAPQDGRPLEEIGFAYRTITWTWNDGGKTFNDDWTQ